jgi:hypothetical protein
MSLPLKSIFRECREVCQKCGTFPVMFGGTATRIRAVESMTQARGVSKPKSRQMVSESHSDIAISRSKAQALT